MGPLGFRKPEAVVASPDVLPSLFSSAEGAHLHRPTNFLWSLLLHTLAVATLIFLARVMPDLAWNGRPPGKIPFREAPFTIRCDTVKECGGGGGDQEKTPATWGVLPPRSKEQFTPPTTHAAERVPALPMVPTIIAPDTPLPDTGPLGDPRSPHTGPASDGPGKEGGIGSGKNRGVGDGVDPGAGDGRKTGINYERITGKVRPPRPIFAPDPEYSEEGRKVKAQGAVVLWVGVGPDGRVRDVRVQRSLGFGLDEKALEAVRRWTFEPATVDEQPVAVQINVEVRFRLY